MKLSVKNTFKYGKGVFAAQNIKKGDIVYILEGIPMDVKDFVNDVMSGKQHIDNALQISKRIHVKLNKLSNTFNHSCDPNCGLRKKTELFALRDIKKGEELSYDYSLTVAPTVWKMNCKCKSKNCRKEIRDILSVPKKRLNEYINHGAIQDYMKRLLILIQNKKYKIPKYEIEAIKKLN